MAGLGVNIDHVATVRQARRTVEPDPIWAAVEAELGGADCITFHLRKDRRHIVDRDARVLRETVQIKLNMEMSLDEEIVQVALETKPGQATLVPESREEITTEGGLDVVAHAGRMREVTARLQDAGIEVSAFIDPVTEQIRASKEVGCDAIEIHTGAYANAVGDEVPATLEAIEAGVAEALAVGLIVHGGHGLTYNNIAPIAAMPGFCEFNIGHSIVSRAIFVGMREAVIEMKRLLDKYAPVAE
ncbi:MAG: pyridoxine 5'-phosphate synthase [Planctomycetota bacterium]|jgi:pyridoxine 5-phosphate synthase